MTEQEMRDSIVARNAVLNQLNQMGLRPLAGSEDKILLWFKDRGVSASAPNGYLVLVQADGSACVPSSACETLRKERPELFASSPRFDKISSLEDFNRGTQQEIAKAKSDYIRQHGEAAYTALPRTKEQAELKSAEVSPAMSRREWLACDSKTKSRFISAMGDSATQVVATIMSRRDATK